MERKIVKNGWMIMHEASALTLSMQREEKRIEEQGSVALRLHLKVIEEFHLSLSKNIPGSTISIGGKEKKRKTMNELQMSSLKENFDVSYSLQGTEDASKWNECLNPLLFALVHKCWFDPSIRQKNNLPPPTDAEITFEMVCRMGFYYLLIKRIHLGIGFMLENENFFTRLHWHDLKLNMLNTHNQEWFATVQNTVDEEDYIPASSGFLMGMAIEGIEVGTQY